MSSQAARDFLDAIKIDQKVERAQAPSEDRPVKLGIVDSAYTGVGAAKVTFDGEATMGSRTYPTLSTIAANDRVALLPVGHSYVILGSIAGGGGAFRRASGIVNNASSLAVNGNTTQSIVFPVGRFTQPPRLVGSATTPRLTVAFSGVSTTGATIALGNWSDASVGAGVASISWIAEQGTPGSSDG